MIIYVSNIISIGSVIVVMITIGSRIRYLREQKNLSMKALAAHITETTGIKVSSGQISDWENGNKNPSSDGLIAVSTFFEVSADWILTGKERPTPKIEQQESPIFFADKWETTSHFSELSEEEKEKVKEYIEFLRFKKEKGTCSKKTAISKNDELAAARIKEEKVEYRTSEIEEDAHAVPLVGKTAAGIEKNYYEFILGYMPVPSKYTKGTCFVMEVDGDSMTGDGIENGDYVVIQQQPIVECNEIALLRINDEEITLKRIYNAGDRVVLLSSNADYPERSLPTEKVKVVGKFIYRIPGNIGKTILRDELF